ncbi:MAG: phosphoenolpyruvate--protein phosphotransferase [Fibrobacter sp.]|nr:phosphoenolpyruvate--protein phosphotransferase [Fibrobacter sp.]
MTETIFPPYSTFSIDFTMDHFQLICDIGELNEVFTKAQSIEAFLQKIVDLVARHMRAAVCSVYLYEEDRRDLVLRATKGLKQESVGMVRLKIGEGLTGLAVKEMRPVCEKIGKNNPKFKHIPGISEEKYDAFLAVPIQRGISRIGALVVQRERKKEFKEREIAALRAVASQLANMLENAKLFMSLQDHPHPIEKRSSRTPKLFKGKVASEGFAQGPALIFDRGKTLERLSSDMFTEKYTLEDFYKAVLSTENQLKELQERVEEKLSDVASLIFTAHLLLLKDKEFVGSMVRRIEEGMNPPDAIIAIAKHYIDIFSHAQNVYIQEKVQDIEDLSIRLLNNIVASSTHDLCQCENSIAIARELFPSDILKLSSENARGLVLVTGGVTSHLSILARSLKMPLIIVDNPKLLSIPNETPLLLDAEVGNLYVNPSNQVISSFKLRDEARKKITARKIIVNPETYTSDGVRIFLKASINLLSDLKLAEEVKCEGIGLYRTEFPFLIRSDFPTEEEQYVIYRKLIESMPGKEITFRTLDIGGDKVLSYFAMPNEQNPFLGMRSIRFSLANKDLFFQQLRAMLRAGVDAQIRIMFPLISSMEELLEAKAAVEESIRHLKEKKIPHNSNPSIGVMIEIPSVIDIMDEITDEVDFCSIGTNDLVQYMLAVDRTNEKVASLYIPHHPAILRAIKRICDTATKKGVSVAICGDMGHNEKYLPFFIGAGIRELTIEPSILPKIQEAITKIDSQDALQLTETILRACKVQEISRLLK